MGDYNEIPDVPLETALGSGMNTQTSVTDITSRSIDMKSGSLVVNSPNGKIAQLGVQADGTFNLKFFDPKTGIGTAQFGQYPDNSTALKVAKTGVEVSTATNNQLIFNSSQDIFKIVKKLPLTIPAFNTTFGGTVTTGGSSAVVPHGQTFTPIVQVYVQGAIVNFNNGSLLASTYVPLPIVTADINSYYFENQANNTEYPLSIVYGVDATNVYVQAFYKGTGNDADTIGSISGTIFLLQETAT
jgi:hypothetical protein